MAKGRKEEDDGVHRGEWGKNKKPRPSALFTVPAQSIIVVQKVTCSLHTIWPSTWRTWRLTIAAHYTRKKRDMITSQKNRPFPVRNSPRVSLTARAHIYV